MKVEIFWIQETTTITEQMINEWLVENPDIEIKHILQSADGAQDDGVGVISIWYEEKE